MRLIHHTAASETARPTSKFNLDNERAVAQAEMVVQRVFNGACRSARYIHRRFRDRSPPSTAVSHVPIFDAAFHSRGRDTENSFFAGFRGE